MRNFYAMVNLQKNNKKSGQTKKKTEEKCSDFEYSAKSYIYNVINNALNV